MPSVVVQYGAGGVRVGDQDPVIAEYDPYEPQGRQDVDQAGEGREPQDRQQEQYRRVGGVEQD